MSTCTTIKPIIKRYIAKYFDGFNEFSYFDNLIDMGITTNEFLFSLIQFLEKKFEVKIYQHELFKTFTINGIANLIDKKMKSSQSSQKMVYV